MPKRGSGETTTTASQTQLTFAAARPHAQVVGAILSDGAGRKPPVVTSYAYTDCPKLEFSTGIT